MKFCFSQSAARTASQLIVVTADPTLWHRSHQPLLGFIRSVKAPKPVILYYHRLIPGLYRLGILNSLAFGKWIAATFYGFFRPTARGPYFLRDLQDVAIKSAALGAQNLVLALTAQGCATCMMEGFDEVRVKRLLGLGRSARVVMVIAVGKEAPRGTWGPQFRLDNAEVIHQI